MNTRPINPRLLVHSVLVQTQTGTDSDRNAVYSTRTIHGVRVQPSRAVTQDSTGVISADSMELLCDHVTTADGETLQKDFVPLVGMRIALLPELPAAEPEPEPPETANADAESESEPPTETAPEDSAYWYTILSVKPCYAQSSRVHHYECTLV